MQKRKNLKLFRIKRDLTQFEMSERLRCSFSMYSMIERGERDGTLSFWQNLQETFAIPSGEMWSLTMKGEHDAPSR